MGGGGSGRQIAECHGGLKDVGGYEDGDLSAAAAAAAEEFRSSSETRFPLFI